MNPEFKYYPIEILNEQTGEIVRGFKFPADDIAYDDTNPADVENLQQFQILFGINEVISSITDIIKTGTTKTNKYYQSILQTLKEDYNKACIHALSIASSFCWVPNDPTNLAKGYVYKLHPQKALTLIEPLMKAELLAVQTKMDLTFPLDLVQRKRRLESEKEILDIEEVTGGLKET